MRNKIIYVSGPYRGKTEAQVFANIMRARDAAIKLWAAGWVVICPHLNTMLFGGIVSEEDFLDGDLELLRRCDAIFLLADWEASAGARAEYEAARMAGKTIYCEWDGIPKGR